MPKRIGGAEALQKGRGYDDSLPVFSSHIRGLSGHGEVSVPTDQSIEEDTDQDKSFLNIRKLCIMAAPITPEGGSIHDKDEELYKFKVLLLK